MNPCWRDIRGIDPHLAIEAMYSTTGCLKYYCNDDDYASWGWTSGGARVPIRSCFSTFVTVIPSEFCPPGLIWPDHKENAAKKLESDLRKSIQREEDLRIAAESKIAAYVNAFEKIYAAMRGIK